MTSCVKPILKIVLFLGLVNITGHAAAETETRVSVSHNVTMSVQDYQPYVAILEKTERKKLASDEKLLQEFILDIHSNKSLAKKARTLGLDKNPLVNARIQQAVNGILIKELMQKVRKEKLESLPNLEVQAKEHYYANIDKFKLPEQRYVSHILLLPKSACAFDKRHIDERISEVQFRLLGESFEKVAALYSQDSESSDRGGKIHIPIVNNGSINDEFEEAVFAIPEIGMISDPVETSFGIHIIRLDEIKKPRIKDYQDVKNEIIDSLRNKSLEDAMRLERGYAYPDLNSINTSVLKEYLVDNSQ